MAAESVKAWFKSPRPTSHLIEYIAGALLLGGVIGIIVNAALLNVPGPGTTVYPHFFGLWLSIFMTFYSLQIFWQYHLSIARPRRDVVCNLGHYIVLDAVVFFVFLGSCIGLRADGAVWSVFIEIGTLLNTLLAWHRYRAMLSNDKSSPLGSTSMATAAEDGMAAPAEGDGVSVGRLSPVWLRVLTVFNALLLAIAFLFFCLVMGGTWVQAVGYASYPPPPGSTYTVSYGTGLAATTGGTSTSSSTTAAASTSPTTQVVAYCTGPVNASLPTFLFDIGGGGHSSSDLYGLQDALNALGRRVCTYDYPGCGNSGYAASANQPVFLDQIAAALGEPGPFILIGTMDGGPERIYQFALAEPSKVVALIPITWGAGEFPSYQKTRNLTDAQALSYARTTLAGRLGFGNIIVALGVQWGFMSFFVPPSSTFVPQAREAEKRFLNLFTEKQWVTQVNILAQQVADPSLVFVESLWASNRTLNAAIPVFNFYNQPNVTADCVSRRYAIGSADCNYLFAEDAISLAFNQAMVNMTAGSELVVCQDCTRNGQFLSGDTNLPWLVENIMRLVGNITVSTG